MAVTAVVSENLGSMGNKFARRVTITGDSSYAAGGETVSANECGLGRIDSLIIEGCSVPSYIPKWDQTNGKLLMFNAGIQSVSKAFTARANFTDGGSTSGLIDYATGALPIGAVPISSQLDCTTAGSGDTSATWQLGIAGALDIYSTTTTNSCFTAIKTSSLVKTTGLTGTNAAQTPRLTVTTAADFTAINTAFAGTSTLFYLMSAGTTEGEETAAVDLSAVTITALVYGTG